MNKKIWESVIVLILFAIIFFFAVHHAKAPFGPVSNDDQKVTFTVKTIKNDTKTLSTDISYPEISGISDALIEISINKDIKKTIDGLVAQSTDDALNSPNISLDGTSSLNVSYRELDPSHGILSIPFEVSEYSLGAAHPNNYDIVLNYDLSTGKIVALKDLFKDGSDYLSVLSKISQQKIPAKFPDNTEPGDFWLADGASPKEENFSVWYISGDVLTIIFNPYQVAPYVFGIIEIPIPFEELVDISK